MSQENVVRRLEHSPFPSTRTARSRPLARRVYLVLLAILLLALALRLWRLDQNDYGNAYYTAAVRSMTVSWHNFLYNSFDPAGFVSLDKPPVALWVQVLSVKLFGFRGLSVLLPQILDGVAAVALLYHLMQHQGGQRLAFSQLSFLLSRR